MEDKQLNVVTLNAWQGKKFEKIKQALKLKFKVNKKPGYKSGLFGCEVDSYEFN